MSVLKRNRKLSKAQFIVTAADIAEDIAGKCKKMPKTVRYTIGIPLQNLAEDLVVLCMAANEVKPEDEDLLLFRKENIVKAIAVSKRINYIVVEKAMYGDGIRKGVPESAVSQRQWLLLLNSMQYELALLEGVLASDERRRGKASGAKTAEG